MQMNEKLKDRIRDIYNQYLKYDPKFLQFYKHLCNYDTSEVRVGSPDIEKELGSPSFTLEAEQNLEPEKQIETGKERSIGDMILNPTNAEEEILSTAVQSGFLEKSIMHTVEKMEANLSNTKDLVDMLEKKVAQLMLQRQVELEKSKNVEKELESKQEKEVNDLSQKDKAPALEYGVLDEIQRKFSEVTKGQTDSERPIKGKVEDVKGGNLKPDCTPEGAREAAQQQKPDFGLPKHE